MTTAEFRIGGEDALSAWIRRQPDLDSGKKFFCTDIDHTYVWHHRRDDVNHVMVIEAKTRGADIRASQEDSLSIFSQIADSTKLIPVYSPYNRRHMAARWWGVFLLRMSGTCPDDSQWMTWRKINDNQSRAMTLKSPQELVDLLSFSWLD